MADNSKDEVLGLSWMDGLDESYSEAAAVDEQRRFPYAQVDNAKDARGAGGGLWIKRRDNLPEDTRVDAEVFRDKTLVFDSQTGEVEEEGIISDHYHVAIIAYTKDRQGRPSGYRDVRSGKWIFPVLLAVKEAFSPSTPFRVVFKGSNAVRMSNMIRDHGNLVIAALSRDLREAKGSAAKPLGRNQVWMTITHAREQLASVKNPAEKSWGCPLQDFVKESIRENIVDGKSRRSGTSVYQRLSEKEAAAQRARLVIAPEQARLFAQWAEQFQDEATWAPQREPQAGDDASSFNYGDNARMAHFAASREQQISEKQQGFLLKLCKDLKTECYTEIMYLISTEQLQDPPPGYEDMDGDALFGLLSKSGASVVIDHLKKQAEATGVKQKEAGKAAAGDALRRMAASSARPSLDEDEVI